MAFSFSKQVLVETTKRLVIKLVGTGAPDDAGNLAINSMALSGFIGNSNSNVGLLNIKSINYSVSSNASVKLYWYGANSNSTIAILSHAGTLPAPGTDGFVINPDANGATGNVWISTGGFKDANASYTIILDIHKDPKYYDPGTSLDPAAFNR